MSKPHGAPEVWYRRIQGTDAKYLANYDSIFRKPTVSPRAEHLAWCKKRALQYCDAGDVASAFASLSSDLSKDDSTAGHMGIELGMRQLMNGGLSTPGEMRHYIEGFN